MMVLQMRIVKIHRTNIIFIYKKVMLIDVITFLISVCFAASSGSFQLFNCPGGQVRMTSLF